uniref:Fasciculation and elongation protein zeta-1-like n=1 Tax=Castor canadensis TaxID=51338 RepID=A0A8B7WJ17_CASCN
MTPYLDQLLVSSSEAGDNCVAVWGGHPGKAGREIGTQRPPLRLPLHSFEALSYKVTTLRHFLAPKQEQETACRTIHEKEEEEFNEKSENDSGINEEPLLTADQVIEEIEEMMQNSPDPEEEEEVLEEDDGGEISSQADSVLLQEMQALTQTFNNNWSYEGLRHMSGSELTQLLDQVEGAIRDFSEELVHQLARRDELEFEKEVKNSFITVLIEVQNKQKEQRELMKKRRKEKGLSLQSSRIEKGNQMPLKRFSMEGISNILQSGIRQTFGSSGTDKQYLNTVIPYEKKSSPPSVEDLQMLTNILFAMKEDNEKVPTLLTDYILK